MALGIKHLLDKVFAIIFLILFSPVFLIVGIILKLQKEDVFYLQKRTGLNGNEFTIFKFTTMPKGSEKLGLITTSKDSRPTPLGRILRKTKLNELPQLVNILLGDMSFIGPRPIIKTQILESLDEQEITEYYAMRPGLTGMASVIYHHEDKILAQVNNPQKYYNEVLMPQKKELEKIYSTNWNLFLDLKILSLTFKALLLSIFGIESKIPINSLIK